MSGKRHELGMKRLDLESRLYNKMGDGGQVKFPKISVLSYKIRIINPSYFKKSFLGRTA